MLLLSNYVEKTYLRFMYLNFLLIVTMNNFKLLGIPLAVLLTITIISAGFTNSAYAHDNKVKVGCKDLDIAIVPL
jgi:hypothetical protein